jgi:hypothetical protein
MISSGSVPSYDERRGIIDWYGTGGGDEGEGAVSGAAAATPGMVRPTFSSNMKEAKFPGVLALVPGQSD